MPISELAADLAACLLVLMARPWSGAKARTNLGGLVASAALDEATYHAGLLESTERIAEILTSAEPALRVTTCPDWTLSDLALHLGRAHRWAQRIIETRAQKPIDMSAVDLGLPETTTRYGAWLCSGATAFSAAVQIAGTRTAVELVRRPKRRLLATQDHTRHHHPPNRR